MNVVNYSLLYACIVHITSGSRCEVVISSSCAFIIAPQVKKLQHKNVSSGVVFQGCLANVRLRNVRVVSLKMNDANICKTSILS